MIAFRPVLTALAGVVVFAGLASAQNGAPPRPPQPDPEHHAGGRVISIEGSRVTVEHRDETTDVIVVTSETTFEYEREPATLADFAAGDFMHADGERGADDTLVAEHVFGGSHPPPPPPPPGLDPDHQVVGRVVSVDTSAKTISVSRRGGATDVIHTTDATTFERDRAPATLAAFVAGDRVSAHGDRDTSGAFVADHVVSGHPGHGAH
jgi:hypothetical protein